MIAEGIKMEAFAITERGYRAISKGAPLVAGEREVGEIPASLLAAIRLAQARGQRTTLLRGCDWTQAPDSPLDSDAKLAWAVYRQELRDLPQKAGFPDCDWPAPPALPEGATSMSLPDIPTN
ncbi:TPA: phage tail assembly chaperone [Stenotrophomonas maltophilia]|uniref:tail fiber assembly protein n=2 Tax=Stenotrophomonas maltophilia TaxID=40324 RepID=UPI002805B57F|nr:tail fiber assembly protein [Stenotrophomonas maltophilia]MCU1041909.1 phage tail assembly chaperone [Stenotrophomonas maltophilia]WME83255.1 tail fiber assembly protein [Stenotrophomonas maltophilia]HEL3850613.1 phage tail assembly chaperone [Stenotrophomonas maltophilia]